MSDENGYLMERELGDGRFIFVQARPFNSIIGIGPVGFGHYEDHWCYSTPAEARAAAVKWDPLTEVEPEGWFRHAQSGRRRPDGDKAREYIRA